jgi:hypothetical protein
MRRYSLVRFAFCLWVMNTAGHQAVRDTLPRPVPLPPHAQTSRPVDRRQVENILAETPLSFEANRGQAAPDVLYLARSAMYGVSLRRDRVTLSIPDQPMTDISIRLTGSRPPANIEGLDSQRPAAITTAVRIPPAGSPTCRTRACPLRLGLSRHRPALLRQPTPSRIRLHRRAASPRERRRLRRGGRRDRADRRGGRSDPAGRRR